MEKEMETRICFIITP